MIVDDSNLIRKKIAREFDQNKFELIENDIVLTDDNYYEFNITHNSDYILTNDKLDKSLLVSNENEVVDFQKSKSVQLLLLGVGIIAIIAVLFVIVILKKKNKK